MSSLYDLSYPGAKMHLCTSGDASAAAGRTGLPTARCRVDIGNQHRASRRRLLASARRIVRVLLVLAVPAEVGVCELGRSRLPPASRRLPAACHIRTAALDRR